MSLRICCHWISDRSSTQALSSRPARRLQGLHDERVLVELGMAGDCAIGVQRQISAVTEASIFGAPYGVETGATHLGKSVTSNSLALASTSAKFSAPMASIRSHC